MKNCEGQNTPSSVSSSPGSSGRMSPVSVVSGSPLRGPNPGSVHRGPGPPTRMRHARPNGPPLPASGRGTASCYTGLDGAPLPPPRRRRVHRRPRAAGRIGPRSPPRRTTTARRPACSWTASSSSGSASPARRRAPRRRRAAAPPRPATTSPRRTRSACGACRDGAASSCDGPVEVIDFEYYVKGVLAARVDHVVGGRIAAAGAVAVRTYAAWWVNAGGKYDCADICDTTSCQVYDDDRNGRRQRRRGRRPRASTSSTRP